MTALSRLLEWLAIADGIPQTWTLLTLKATLLVLCALGINQVLRWCRASAATQHWLWATTLGLLTLLPAFSLGLPQWNTIPVAAPPGPSVSLRLMPSPPSGQPIDARIQTHVSDTTTASLAEPIIMVAYPTPRSPSPTPTLAIVPDHSWIAKLWLTGFCSLLAVVLLGAISLFRLRRFRSQPADLPLQTETNRLRTQLGITSPVRVLQCATRQIPMTWGCFRPVILLPTQASDWSPAERTAVLAHELAHIKRYDSSLQWLAHLACALHWYNPLAWIAAHKLRNAQETACDDTVLNLGTNAPQYAHQLTAIVAQCQNRAFRMTPALAAARPGKLERRIHDILSPEQNRTNPTRSQMTTISLSLATLALTLAATSPVIRAAAKDTTPTAPVGKQTSPERSLGAIRDSLANQSVNRPSQEKLTRAAIDGMLQELDDPHALYLAPEELADMRFHIEGELFGIGAKLQETDSQFIITEPIPRSPAARADLRARDIIVSVDGKSVTGISLTQLVERIRGPINTEVTLTLKRDGNEIAKTVRRGRIPLPTVFGLRGTEDPQGKARPHQLGRQGRMGYYQVSYVGNHTAQELQALINEQNPKGIILDLRFCPGGTLNAAAAVADLFLQEGAIVHLTNQDGAKEAISAQAAPYLDQPLVVLINQETASAAEIVAGALQDHERAVVVGTRTFGKASVQSLVELGHSLGAVRLTTGHYFPPNERNIDRQPDAETWGIDATEGYFVATDPTEYPTLKSRLTGAQNVGNKPIRINPSSLDALGIVLHDVQLTAALTTLKHRLDKQAFHPTGGTRQALQAHVRQTDLRNRQLDLLQKLEAVEATIRDWNPRSE